MQNSLSLSEENPLLIQESTGEDYTLIEINKRIYAIEAKNVLEILKIIELDYPSELPSCILGIIKYDNTPVGVIDLREVFKKERVTYDLNSKIVLIENDDKISAIVCDKIIDIKKLDKDRIHPIPYQNDTPFYKGLYIDEEENIYILDIENIVKHIETNSDKFRTNGEISNYLVCDEESKAILKERKDFLMSVTREVQTGTPLYDRGVSFLINDVKYYINMASVKEFYKVNNSKFTKVPNTPKFIYGLVNIKGEYITIIDLRVFYNNTKTEIKEKSTIIILNVDEYKIGILADEICESMNMDFEEILQNKLKKQDDGKMNEFVKDGEIYQIVDVEKLLKDDRLTVA